MFKLIENEQAGKKKITQVEKIMYELHLKIEKDNQETYLKKTILSIVIKSNSLRTIEDNIENLAKISLTDPILDADPDPEMAGG